MASKVTRCSRCNKRCRDNAGWNEDVVAGLSVGALCPTCQTPAEDLEAELNLILNHPTTWRAIRHPDGTDADLTRYLTEVIQELVNVYPDPKIMRQRASYLEERRKDREARWRVKLMRQVADDMESGVLFEPDGAQ